MLCPCQGHTPTMGKTVIVNLNGSTHSIEYYMAVHYITNEKWECLIWIHHFPSVSVKPYALNNHEAILSTRQGDLREGNEPRYCLYCLWVSHYQGELGPFFLIIVPGQTMASLGSCGRHTVHTEITSLFPLTSTNQPYQWVSDVWPRTVPHGTKECQSTHINTLLSAQPTPMTPELTPPTSGVRGGSQSSGSYSRLLLLCWGKR